VTLDIGSFVWGVRDVSRAVAFWTAALDYVPRQQPEDDWAVLIPRAGRATGPQLALDLVESPKAKRHHLDLYADDIEAEAMRLIELGATRDDTWDYGDDADYIVLRDPDGNAFCVAQRWVPPEA
jgi:catechol 2,3-dioxygenase-like lactoylglutathione lyase family enzyme